MIRGFWRSDSLTPANNSCSTILVIEDDDAIRGIIQHALELEGYQVRSAPDGRSGLHILKTVSHPCLILLDLMLPVMNGWEFLEELRSRSGDMLATIPVVITSAAGGAADTAAAQAQGYVKKPIDLEHLFRVVRKFCGPPPVPDMHNRSE